MKKIERLFKLVSDSLVNINSKLSYDRTIEAIIRLAEEVEKFDGDTESIWYLGESSLVTLDSLLVESYWFAVHRIDNRGCIENQLHTALCGIFDPGMSSDENGEVYALLEQKQHKFN